MKDYKKVETAKLFKIMDSDNISIDEKSVIKNIIEDRTHRQEKAMKAIEAADVTKLLKEYKLDWTIGLYPLAVATLDGEVISVHEKLHWPMRDDSLEMIGRFACSEDRSMLQNKDLIELGLRLANSEDSELTFAKAIGDGGSIIVAIRAGGKVKIGPDVVQRYIYLLDNRTGEHGLRIGFGETNLRCSNQMNFVNKNAAHSLRHTKTMNERLASLIETYDVLEQEITMHNEFVQQLSERTISDENWDDVKYSFIDLLLDVDLRGDFNGQRVPAGYDIAVLLDDSIEEEMEQIGKSLWTLLNGVTLMTTHKRDQLYPRSETPELQKDIAYGKAGEIATKAYQILLTL